MIEAARDLLVPPRDALELWHALGEPPISGLTPTTSALQVDPSPAFRATAVYLWGVWRGLPDSQIAVPRVSAPTIKIGLLDESGVGISPAVQWQFLTLLSRPDHLSLLHLDVGLTARPLHRPGPDADSVRGRRPVPAPGRPRPRSYLSFHVAL